MVLTYTHTLCIGYILHITVLHATTGRQVGQPRSTTPLGSTALHHLQTQPRALKAQSSQGVWIKGALWSGASLASQRLQQCRLGTGSTVTQRENTKGGQRKKGC